MSYEKQNFVKGQVLKADHLNHMEDGIAAAATGVQGPKGDKGEPGPQGLQGNKGEKGDAGTTPNLSIGTVTTGTSAAATITGTPEAPVLNLTLPKGDKGDAGAKGADGAAGVKGDKGDTGDGISKTAKDLLVTLFENAVYKTDTMQNILNALRVEWGGSAQDIPVQSVSLSAVTLTLSEGESKTLTATVLPVNATNKTVVWSVSPSGFATVADGKVTANKAGTCTVTATAGGKSVNCVVTVEVAETAQLIYTLPSETELTNGFDTGLKLLEHASTETPQYTILLDAKASDSLDTSKWPDFLHCLTETGSTNDLPGFVAGTYPTTGKTTLAYYNTSCCDLSDSIEHVKTRTRYVVQIDGKKARGGSTYCPLSDWVSAWRAGTDVPQTFMIGAAQSADGSKKQQLWAGTLYQCRVYKGLLSDAKLNDYIEKGW